MSSEKMIDSPSAIAARFGSYVRKLQNFVIEVDRVLPMIDKLVADLPSDDMRRLQIQYTLEELRKHVAEIENAAEADE